MKKIFTLAILLGSIVTFAQNGRTLNLNEDKNLIEVTYYHDNGIVSQTGFYTTEGKLQGEWLSYDIEGDKTVSANYDDGKKVGKWFYWNGNTLKEVDYTNNAVASVNEWTNKASIASRN
jgi:antitoxin component YwqK of YwqJK toxin-antitoxin module